VYGGRARVIAERCVALLGADGAHVPLRLEALQEQLLLPLLSLDI
jgi:hypothetical protein